MLRIGGYSANFNTVKQKVILQKAILQKALLIVIKNLKQHK